MILKKNNWRLEKLRENNNFYRHKRTIFLQRKLLNIENIMPRKLSLSLICLIKNRK